MERVHSVERVERVERVKSVERVEMVERMERVGRVERMDMVGTVGRAETVDGGKPWMGVADRGYMMGKVERLDKMKGVDTV